MPQAVDLWTKCCEATLDVVFPRKCALCLRLREAPVCVGCRNEFISADPPFRPETGSLDYRAVAYRYEGRAAQAVRRLKYSRATSLAEYLAYEMREAYARLNLDANHIVPVPIHWRRRAGRGFNQAELLCGALPWTPGLLARVRSTRPQVGLSREERVRNLAGAFRADAAVAGKRILLVDDVLTSGQTARECAAALRAAGAIEVGILAFCGEV